MSTSAYQYLFAYAEPLLAGVGGLYALLQPHVHHRQIVAGLAAAGAQRIAAPAAARGWFASISKNTAPELTWPDATTTLFIQITGLLLVIAALVLFFIFGTLNTSGSILDKSLAKKLLGIFLLGDIAIITIVLHVAGGGSSFEDIWTGTKAIVRAPLSITAAYVWSSIPLAIARVAYILDVEIPLGAPKVPKKAD